MAKKKVSIITLKNPTWILFLYMLIVSAITYIGAYYQDVWVFECMLGWIGITALLVTSNKFRFSNFVYFLVGIHFLVLAIGAHYSYAEMPLFDWLKNTFHLQRNYYDRVGHFMQGFVPAIIARELLIRKTKLERGKMMSFLIVSSMLGLSAFYEFIEWWMVIFIYPTQGIEWLGTQGDIWDAQGDMFMAFSGAILALLLLSKAHDKSIKKLMTRKAI